MSNKCRSKKMKNTQHFIPLIWPFKILFSENNIESSLFKYITLFWDFVNVMRQQSITKNILTLACA